MTSKTKSTKPAPAKRHTTKTAAAAPAPAPKPEAAPAPAPKAKAKAKVERTTKYLPTVLGLVMEKGKPSIVVGKRRIEAAKGEVVDQHSVFWSQIRYWKVGKTAAGKYVLTTTREAAAKGHVVIE